MTRKRKVINDLCSGRIITSESRKQVRWNQPDVQFCLFFLKINKTTGFHRTLESLKQTHSFSVSFLFHKLKI